MSSRHSNNAKTILAQRIKAEALNLGFFACGIAPAEQVEEHVAAELKQWLGSGCHADMDYLNRNTDVRLDPRLLLEGARSIVCVALNYAPAQRIPNHEFQLAAYAYGKDYHDVVKAKLHTLAARLQLTRYRAFCDSAPIMERYWAMRAGLGWMGRNHQLIIPHAGSMFFLGELLIDVELDYDTPISNRCGSCMACIEACPTGAISMIPDSDDGQTAFRSDLCLSYLTIENRHDIPPAIARKMGNSIYGCDRCQQACPHNRFAEPTNESMLQPNSDLLNMTRDQWLTLTEEQYRQLFKGSAVKRAKYEGLMRNIRAANQNQEP